MSWCRRRSCIRHRLGDAFWDEILRHAIQIVHGGQNLRVGQALLLGCCLPAVRQRVLVAIDYEQGRTQQRMVRAYQPDEFIVDRRVGHRVHEIVRAGAQRCFRRVEFGGVHGQAHVCGVRGVGRAPRALGGASRARGARSRRADRGARCRDHCRHQHRTPGRRAWEASVGHVAIRARLALASRSRRQPLVPDATPVSSTAAARLAVGQVPPRRGVAGAARSAAMIATPRRRARN